MLWRLLMGITRVSTSEMEPNCQENTLMPRIWTQEEIDAEMEAYAEAEALDAIADKVLRYRPQPKSKPARRRKRQADKLKLPK